MSGGLAEIEIGNQRCVFDLYHVHPEEEKLPPSTGVHLSSSNTKKVPFTILIGHIFQMENQRRWEDLNFDCLINILGRVDMESLLLDVPFVCKSWHKATLNPLCWKHLVFPGNEKFNPWNAINGHESSWGFQNLVKRFESQYRIDGSRCSVTTFIKFIVNRSGGKATLLKLPRCCTVEVFKYVTTACPEIKTLSIPENLLFNKHMNLELIGKWKKLEVVSLDLGCSFYLEEILAVLIKECKQFCGLDLSNAYIFEHEASTIVNLAPTIKYLNLRGAKTNRYSVYMILKGCKDLVVFDARNCVGFNEDDSEISKHSSHVKSFKCKGSQLLECLIEPSYGMTFGLII